ncbi:MULTISPECIES: hypothetical protein [unclassified Myroides]|uniref:hypothetical protein n=1 Tax=unclassified Myroides TaxID=2642485 RepID=UPI0015FCF9F4|nr:MULTISPECIES: hypothetical protein [unclassified Myroides]MBB1149109.1 hypothetical protein [Myroides sp. NP-2]MDM1406132.1 hypothetical protein [Myroides sp. DF42-4-2]
MKNYLLAVSSLFILSLTACKDTGKEPSNITIDGTATEQPASAAPATGAEATPAPNTAAQPATNQASTTQATGAKSNLNPPHGQPGHRCDIQVGAPLDTPPGGGMSATATPASTASQGQPFLVNDAAKSRIAQEQGQTASSGKINPPHGQPGHRCDIQVGQPLP